MFGAKEYNYEAFTKDLLAKDVLLDQFTGPEPGERAPDFTLQTLDGEEISLHDYRRDANVVLTLGSATCPFTAASIGGLGELYEKYKGQDVAFLFVYVREAHPGERLPSHKSMDAKLNAADIFRREEEIQMPVLVDNLKGGIHRKYGSLPNPTYIVDKSGRVAFRCLWTRPSVINEALQELLERQRDRDVDHAIVHSGEDTSMPSVYAMLHAFRALERGGAKSIRDFRREMGVPGKVAVTASRMLEPVSSNPGKAFAAVGITAGVVVGGILLGRFLRERRFRTPYDIERHGMPRRKRGDRGDYEAVGI
jgi:peroxiredoxin